MFRCPHCKKTRIDDMHLIKFACGTVYEPGRVLKEVGQKCALRWKFDRKLI